MRKKRILPFFLAVLLTAGCAQKEKQNSGYKIGLMTGTVAQGEEEYRAAEKMLAKYGDKIVAVTYPDNFVKEQETTIANMMQLASDPEVKVIIMCIGITGASAAFEKVRQMRPDILLICGNTVEDPDMIAERCDIVIHPDEVGMGHSVIEQADKMGAKTFVHYSFPRHMAVPMYAQRRDIMKEECERRGIAFIEETCPDPTGDLGISGAQMFMTEDIPRKVALYGKDTCFFNTNCSMQEPLIMTSLQEGAIVAQQCCPSPFHGYPGALGLSVAKENAGDTSYIISAIQKSMEEKGGSGRFSTWDTPVNMSIIEASVAYAVEYCEGRTNGKNDREALLSAFEKAVPENHFTFRQYKSTVTGEELTNLYLLLGQYVTF